MSENTEVSLTGGLLNVTGNRLYVEVPNLKGGDTYVTRPTLTGDTYYLSDDIDTLGVDYWPPHESSVEDTGNGGVLTRNEPVETAVSTLPGGRVETTFMDDFYYRVHINPSSVAMGSLFSVQSRSTAVWNAHLEGNTLSAIAAINADGMNLVGTDNPPTVFNALEVRTYSLSVTLEGQSTINAAYAFDFALGPATLYVTGTRVTVFPFEPNWASRVLERLEWLTDVLEMRNGSEQRYRMRHHPRISLEYEAILHGQKTQVASSLLFGWQGKTWGVPMWHQEQSLTTDIAAGDTVVPITTQQYEYFVGGSVILYADYDRHETGKIRAITPTQVKLETGLTNAWPVRTRVMPVLTGVMRDPVQLSRKALNTVSGVFRFFGEEYRPTFTEPPASYKSLPVLSIDSNRATDLAEQWTRKTYLVDNQIGQSLTFDLVDSSYTTYQHELISANLSVFSQYRDFLLYVSGRWKSFWFPTYLQDMELAAPVVSGQSTLSVKALRYTGMVKGHELRKHLRIADRRGNVYYREIISYSEGPNNTEVINLDSPITADISPGFELISYMAISRLDSDVVEVNWLNRAVSSMTLQIKGVKQ